MLHGRPFFHTDRRALDDYAPVAGRETNDLVPLIRTEQSPGTYRWKLREWVTIHQSSQVCRKCSHDGRNGVSL
jgi:hypothetical protein